MTSENGSYTIHNLPVGTYSIQFQLIGYSRLTKKVTIEESRTATLSAQLEGTGVNLGEYIVQSTRTLLRQEQTGTVQTVSAEDIKLLPVQQFQEVIRLQAGTTVEGNVRGGKTTEVMYLMDGMAMQDVLSGGLNTEVPTEAIQEVAVQTGGFEAEYGNALSGVVNVVTKSASPVHKFTVHGAKDDLFSGTAKNRMAQLEATASGPVIAEEMSYIVTGTYRRSGTRWWEDFYKTFDAPVEQTFNGFAKLDLTLSSSTRLAGQALVSDLDTRDYEFSWRFNLDGLPPRKRTSYRLAAILTQSYSENTVWTSRLSWSNVLNRIGSGSASSINPADIYQYDLFLQYIISGKRNLWSKTGQSIINLKSDFSTKSAEHLFKAGVDVNAYDVTAHIVEYEPQKSYFGKPLTDKPPLNFSTAYDYRPYSGALFAQDKFEVKHSGMIVNLGVRFDFLDPRASRPAIEFIPVKGNEFLAQYKSSVPAKMKLNVSPRLGIAIPYSTTGSIFLNYGHYIQFPLFTYLYSGLDVIAQQHGSAALVGNPDLAPEKTIAWELSIRQVLGENLVGSLLYFRKETANQVDTKTFVPSDSKVAGDYGFAEFVNNPTAESQGIELTVKRTEGSIRGEVSYTFMTAEGLSENATQGLYLAQYGIVPYTSPFFLSWDQRHTLKVNLSARLPLGVDAEIFWSYNTARPYTYYPSRDGFTPLDTTIIFVPNNRRMQDYSSVDMKVTRSFSFMESMRATLYADIRNLFNTKSVKWYDSSGRTGGELGDPSAYYTGFRGLIGVRFEF